MSFRDSIGIAAITLVALTGGCGEPDESRSPPSAAAAPEVSIQISGAYAGTFESNGSIYCSEEPLNNLGEGSEVFELYAMKMPEQFNLRMLRNTAPGSYAMNDSNGAPFDFYYTDPKREKYDVIESATIRLTEVPQAQGERLVGEIDATLRSDEGVAVEVKIRLDLDAGSQSFDECG